MSLRCFCAAVLFTFVSLPEVSSQEKAARAPEGPRRVSELADDLSRVLSVAPFQERMTLKEALAALQTEYRARYDKELPILIQNAPFKLENPDAPDLNETEVRLPAAPRQRTAAQILRALIAQVPTADATLCVKPGVIEITTKREVTTGRLLDQTVDLRFEKQPLSFVLDEVYEQTGVYVALDPRVGMRARTPLTLRFTNDLKLGDGLALIAEMANLKLFATDNMVLITTPAAAQAYWEQTTWQWSVPFNPSSAP